jgi:uncharacterized membrane protein
MTATWGPLQVLVVGFGSEERLRGQVRQELHRLRVHGVVRLVDAVVVRRSASGGYATEQLVGDVDESLRQTLGLLVRRLLGLPVDTDGTSSAGLTGSEPEEGLTAGLGPVDLRRLADSLEPGTAVAVVLVEHTWAARLRAGVREAGGQLLLQGILTRDAVLALGQELVAVIEASEAAEVAAASAGAAMAQALVHEGHGHDTTEAAWDQAAEDHARELAAERTSAAGETLRVLMDRGLLARSSGPPAVHALLEEGVIDSRSAAEAVAAGEAVDGRG